MREVGFSARGERLDALLLRPEGARLLYVLAHGAGAGMRHAWLQRMAEALAGEGVATFRYQFPYMQAGRKRIDPPEVLHAAVRAAVAAAHEAAPDLPLIAGGKSLGGRMTTCLADAPRPVPGLMIRHFLLRAPWARPSRDREFRVRE